ncbi:unnamed protein product, partial [Dracunculus medinensis]|uniref:THAP-type domain-containing protein n=1 Tax=Dracunculus medinensis TaxID=318479 RepID=A0A0N4USB5_DRAME
MVQRFYISDKNYDQKTIVKSENVEFSTLMKEDWKKTKNFGCAKKLCFNKFSRIDLTICFYKLREAPANSRYAMKSSSGQNLPLQLKYDLENTTFSSEQEPSTNTSTQNNTVEMSTLDVNSSASQFESFDSDSSESESVEIETVSTYQPTTMETVSTHETTRLADTMQASLGCSKSNITVKVQERVLARHKTYRSTLEYVIAKMHGYLPYERREL